MVPWRLHTKGYEDGANSVPRTCRWCLGQFHQLATTPVQDFNNFVCRIQVASVSAQQKSTALSRDIFLTKCSIVSVLGRGKAHPYSLLIIFSSVLTFSYRRPQDHDESVILFLKMQLNVPCSSKLVSRIKDAIAKECSKRHVPKYIFETPEIPVRLLVITATFLC